MTPEMWLELVPILHQCHAQLAAVRQFPQGMHRVASLPLCSASHVLPWIVGTTSLLVALALRLGGLGCQNSFRFFSPGGLHLQGCRSVDLVLPVGYTVGLNPWRVHGSLSKGGGSMLMLVRDLAP